MKTNRLLVFSSFIILFVCCNGNKKSSPYLLVESSFENSNPFSEWTADQHCCDYSITQNKEKYTDGTQSIRIEVRDSDPKISGSFRAELVQEVDEPITERWYGFNMYLEDWADDVAGESAFEWHPDNAKGVSAASLWLSDGKYVFQTNPGDTNTGSEYTDIGPILNNQWVAWVIHVKWTTDNTGVLQVWQNGKPVIDKTHIKTCSPDGVYFKLGLNKFGWGSKPSTVSKRVIYYDEIRIGDERAIYETVKPSLK